MSNTVQPPVATVAQMLARVHRSDPRFPPFVQTSPKGLLLCHGCRNLNRCRMGLRHEALQPAGSVVSELACPRESEGGPNVAHGGWTAGVLDELVGHALILRGEFAVTGPLEVVFHKPIPIELPLICTTQIGKRQGRRVFVTARIELSSSGALLASAKAIMVKRPADHFERHEAWLGTQVSPCA